MFVWKYEGFSEASTRSHATSNNNFALNVTFNSNTAVTSEENFLKQDKVSFIYRNVVICYSFYE